MSVTVKVDGLKELDKQLGLLKKSTGKAALRRSLKKSAQPLADLMTSLAPRGATASDKLADSIAVGTKLSQRQAKLHRRMFRDNRSSVEMFVGPGPDPAAWNQEFGNINHGPQSFARPAWDRDKEKLLQRLTRQLWVEIEKSIARAALKAAKQG